MFGSSFSAIDISSSGLTAERFRMEVIANNIANAHSTSTPEGGPFRRQQVVFGAALNDSLSAASSIGSHSDLHGVRVLGIVPDESELPQVYNPAHPDADENGMLAMPNVKMPNEMVDLITASRAYEANLRSIRAFRSMAQQTLSLLRGGN